MSLYIGNWGNASAPNKGANDLMSSQGFLCFTVTFGSSHSLLPLTPPGHLLCFSGFLGSNRNTPSDQMGVWGQRRVGQALQRNGPEYRGAGGFSAADQPSTRGTTSPPASLRVSEGGPRARTFL